MSERYLIINADDFGMCRASNEAVIDLFRNGFLRSATVMMPCPGAEEAARFAAEHPEYDIGVHLTTTNEWGAAHPWGSLTGGRTLETPEGRMWKDCAAFERNAARYEIRRELRAQTDRARSFGMIPSHLDNHMGSLYGLNGRLSLLPLVFRLCGRERLPFRMCVKPLDRFAPKGVSPRIYRLFCGIARLLSRLYRVPTPDYLILTDQVQTLREAEEYKSFREAFLTLHGEIPAGITETYIHPALESDEIKAFSGSWRRRSWEYQLMKDPVVRDFFDANGIRLIGYRELSGLRKMGAEA